MRQCASCDKTGRLGGGYSNRTRATKFNPTGKVRRQPNLQWAKLPTAGRAKLCARCLKTGKYISIGSNIRQRNG